MIIDCILDRRETVKFEGKDYYKAKEFYNDIMMYGGHYGDKITYAMDYLEEDDVKKALCDYIVGCDYNRGICSYIWSVNWLVDAK